ncbi:unnamed protein product [Cylindrotheca closterium]|uniref:Uncharacterized protein n=1 Tax=Cylindrotheca closterium TaxID=2856 RepID=A0AAD2G7F7_9STRA|nr:unnamed protein product [Cylindrotheca closterium]
MKKADLFWRNGRHEEAYEMELLEIQLLTADGDDHAALADAYDRMASALLFSSNNDNGELEMRRKALEVRLSYLGHGTTEAADLYDDIAGHIDFMERNDGKALKMRKKALGIRIEDLRKESRSCSRELPSGRSSQNV